MRVLLMFDIPTKTKKEQKHAAKFRKLLIESGYFMIQFSVYMKICKGASSARSSINAIRYKLPPYGNVRALIITEKQFDNMEILLGLPSLNEQMNDDKNVTLFSFDEKSGEYIYHNEDKDDKNEVSKTKIIRNFKQQTLFEF